MSSSASQARGAARSHSKNVARRKRAGVRALVRYAARSEEHTSRVADELAQTLTESALRAMLWHLGIAYDDVIRADEGSTT